MAHEGYHQTISALSDETRGLHRAIEPLIEELEAGDWYRHRAMVLEWPRRKDTGFDKEPGDYLFTDGFIVTMERETS